MSRASVTFKTTALGGIVCLWVFAVIWVDFPSPRPPAAMALQVPHLMVGLRKKITEPEAEGGEEETPATVPASELNRDDLERGLAAVWPAVANCLPLDPQLSQSQLHLGVAQNGEVTQFTLSPPSGVKRATDCVNRAVRTAKFPGFAGDMGEIQWVFPWLAANGLADAVGDNRAEKGE